MSQVRVRIAPSPTGKLHIGTARTALFNYLFAKKNKGRFILRFEDTDRSRSTKEYEKDIMDSLKWLGIIWDEGPYYQMERLDIYKKIARGLIERGLGYVSGGAVWFNVKKAIDLYKIDYRVVKTIKKIDGSQKAEGYLIALPTRDLILGKISGVVEDFVILRSNGIPTYHFAVVVDDADMKISHVIRGQDHLSNTPKHYLLQKALGCRTPHYAHIPLTLGPSKEKLSKRHGAVSVSEYREMGYLPEGLVNFMVFLGWSPKTKEEIFSLKDLERKFSLEAMGKSAAVFNIEKLNWYQQYYLRNLSAKNPTFILKSIKERYKIDFSKDQIKKIIKVYITEGRELLLPQLVRNHSYLYKEPQYSPSLLIFKKSTQKKTLKGLELGVKSLEKVKERDWKLNNLHKALNLTVQDGRLSFGDVFWPVRVALSGADASPSPEELLWILGRDKSLKRIKKAIDLLK